MKPFKRHKFDDNAHPLVRHLFTTMNERRVSKKYLAEKSGVEYSAFAMWQRNVYLPHLGNIEAALGVLGYELVVQRRVK
jgi:hypothetical protein